MEEMNVKEALKVYKALEFECYYSDDQTDLFTENHVKWDIWMRNPANGVEIEYTYQCNPCYSSPNKCDCLMVYINDASYGIGYDVDELAESIGIVRPSEAYRVYNACKKAYNDIMALFNNDEELAWDLLEIFMDDYDLLKDTE